MAGRIEDATRSGCSDVMSGLQTIPGKRLAAIGEKLWHPRMSTEAAHVWLRAMIHSLGKEL